jgi:truncated hemoglobin YjbI
MAAGKIEKKSGEFRVTEAEFGQVPLSQRGRTFFESDDTERLLESIGGEDTLSRLATVFYTKVFEDKHLKPFIFLDDGAEAHGRRLAMWIAEKMGGPPNWTLTRPNNARSRSHRSAWDSEKRSPEKRGSHFKLDDCRTWMRLMFWSAREVGLDEHEPFWNWYVKFIGHFIGIYEFTAPAYAPEDALWSASEENIREYQETLEFPELIGVHHAYRGY